VAHNPEVEGSNPSPATKARGRFSTENRPLACLVLTDLRTVVGEALSDTAWIFGHTLTMTVLPPGDVKSHLPELVGRVHDHHEPVTVTVHGRPSAILIAPEDLEALEETLEIMRDAATMNRLAESDAELARGEYVSAEELAEAMRRRRAQ
jgi:antitoxin YefM